MLDTVKMKESCRICARELHGNQRRWIFHPAAKLNLQVLLSHALGREVSRDGRGEFACSKCTFMLDRMYRFDTVIARVEALSLERLHKLLLEKERLRLCIGAMYSKNNAEDVEEAPVLDLSDLQGGRYMDLVRDDLAYSLYESWADKEDSGLDQQQEQHHCSTVNKSRRCRGCAALRVPDSDYEAICKVPRSVGRRSTSCGPSTRYSPGAEEPTGLTEATDLPSASLDRTACDQASPSPASSLESLDETSCPKPSQQQRKGLDPSAGLEMVLKLVRGWEYQPLRPERGSRLPLLVRSRLERGLSGHHLPVPDLVVPCPQLELQAELEQMEDQWLDHYVQCPPIQQLDQNQSSVGQCVGELQAALLQVRSLQVQVQESESRNQKQQQRLGQLELDLRVARDDAQQQERNIQNLRDSVQTRAAEAAELRHVIQDQNTMLCSFKELADRGQQLQASGTEAPRGQTEVLALQASLFRAQLELQAGQRSQRRAARTQEELSGALRRLEADLQGALQHRRETDRHNQELQLALEETRSLLQRQEERRDGEERARRREEEAREQKVRELSAALQSKERLLRSQLLDATAEPPLARLRQRLAERDRALECAVDDKFRCLEQKEEEKQRLELLLREKQRDLERQRSVLSHNQETITSLELLLRGKSLELQQVSHTCRSAQLLQQEAAERHSLILRERDGLISQLQGALQAHTHELQDLRSSLISGLQSGPSQVLEELEVRLQLKDHLFQEVLSDQARQAQDHQEQVQDLLRTISSRDRYIQDSAGRLAEVMTEQSARLQELRRQLSSKPDSGAEREAELEEAREELRLLRRRQKESEELRRSQSQSLETLSRALLLKERSIEELQQHMAEPSELPLVQRLTLEVQELRESLALQQGPPAREPVPGLDEAGGGGGGELTELGGLSPEEEDEDDDDDDLSSEFTTSVDEEEDPLRRKSSKGPSLVQVQQLVEQKQAVERELCELKLQLEKIGFCSLSQMRKALVDLRLENQELKLQLAGDQELQLQSEDDEEEDEEELDVTIEEQDVSEMWDTWAGDLTLDHLTPGPAQLKARLMVSEAKVQAQQIRDDRDLLTESAVRRDSKQVQVDLQDLGYETCGRSENEAEREDTSSPEFDDLEMCTSLDSQWWPRGQAAGDSASLQRLVEDLHSQLSRSQAVIRGLQGRLRTLSCSEALPRKEEEEEEGWHSSGGGNPTSPRRTEGDLRDLVSRVDALEEQLMRGGKKADGKWPGQFDVLIQSQARDLSHLRQRLREARGVAHVLTQQLGDTTKTFEELLRSSEVDFYSGQNFRQQLAQSSALAQRLGAKIGGRDHPEDPEEKTELLAIRLSRELQQKDKVIESLREKLDQQQLRHSATPTSSHAPSDASDQSDRISYVSDEPNEELVSDVDATSEPALEQTRSTARSGADCPPGGACPRPSPSVTSSVTSSHPSVSLPPSAAAPRPSPPLSAAPYRPRPASFRLADVQQELQALQRQLGHQQRFSTPQSRPLQGFPPLAPQQPDPSGFLPFSFHGYRPSAFSSLDRTSAVQGGAGMLAGGTMWDTAFAPQSLRVGADPSSGSSGYQSGTSHTGSDLMKEHLREIRSLRERLEDSIQTNERLRRQLEERLTHNTPDKGAPTNIYIQGLDSVAQLSAEIRLLKEENTALQSRLEQNTAEGIKEVERLKQASLLDRTRLREAELECEKWAERSRTLQADSEEKQREVDGLKLERQKNQEAINRLQHELSESRRRVCAVTSDPRALQTESPQFHGPSPPGRDAGVTSPTPLHSASQDHMVGHVDHFTSLGQKLQRGLSLLRTVESVLRSLDVSSAHELLRDTHALGRLLEDSASLLQRFWRADVPDESKQEPSEAAALRLKLAQQEQALRDALERVHSSNRTKDCMEDFIVSQLSRTRDVLRRAKTNLQARPQEDAVASSSPLVEVS
ncbi:myomegalin isoform X4 [Synchiropus splendidus]|uniref:myomegalin isoform X4 n=1 Tax=Synchiropus splendidus TaxID=270530 RepID=UPI00237D812F|nr:myomegalin isoform X4 [Synchiropus splendidus]